MKRYIGRILLCVTPVVVSLLVVGWAYAKYMKGEGGFRLGVDLSGGTILVYEVDAAKMTDQARQTFKPEDLAASLKRRIDPADLYNVTIRPVPGDPPRVEIILPTGGPQQARAVREAWDKLLVDVRKEFNQPDDAYKDVPTGQINELVNRVIDSKPEKDGKPIDSAAIANTIHTLAPVGSERRSFTGEEIENIKNLIQQQGRLEFRILANGVDDKDAREAAIAYIKDPKNAEALKAAEAKGEPPAPPAQNGDRYFPVNLGGETIRHQYSWVEVGKEELYSLQLNSSAENTPDADQQKDASRQSIWARAKAAKDKEAFDGPNQTLLYYRTITDLGRVPPRDREMGKKVEFFTLTRETERGKEITGDYLTSVGEGQDEKARRAVHFAFNAEGANLFYELSNRNKPSGQFLRELAVVLDGQVRSAPVLQSAISSNGQISGDFTQKAIEDLVKILRAGALPATLKPNPVSENTMGPTLGQYTINHGALSIGIAFGAVLLFMLVYYRFAGVVACIALLANLLLTVAFMVLVSATFTLPGLAGLVLMLGMAVDANVLIYERIREERERGAGLALAVRNGYDRAFPTIIDTHMTSIFTAIVLYVVGNDQLKGFGISLTVGLIISLFTSLVMTRTMFDISLGQNWLHKLTFMQLFKRPNINFMRIRHLMFGLTVGATILGAALFIYHLGNGGLNIDFVGGTAYAGLLKEPQNLETLQAKLEAPLTQDDLRKLNIEAEPLNFKVDGDLPQGVSVEQVFVNDPTLTVGDRSSLFTVRTTEKNAPKVQLIVNYKLGDLLKRIQSKDPQITEANGKASEASLEFIKPSEKEKPDPDYASVAQVTRLLSAQFAPLDVHRFTVKGVGKEEEGRFSQINVKLEEPIPATDLTNVMAKVRTAFQNTPQPERLENFDSALARDTQQKALYAILASWIAILLYLWFRFGSWTFGAATVLCLIHDLFFTLGAIALCHFVYRLAPGLCYYLGLEDFKIDLPSIAALLTLVGYSVSDTIVVFDRIREVRGKNPLLTYTMINDSVNQTLSRTILSSLTVFLVVGVLYAFGGEGVRLFSFVMVVGVVVGTYSSIYIASPLLIMFGEGAPKTERDRIAAAAHAAAHAAAAQA